MAQEDPNRLVEWYQVLCRQIPAARQRLDEWLAAVRAEPVLIWETAAVRYSAYSLGGVVLLWVVTGFTGMLVPPPPAGAKAEATTADFHVVCSNAQCGRHFVIHRKFGFRGFPVDCSACGRGTGGKARRCNSDACRGRWVAPMKTGDASQCPRCQRRLE